MVSDSTSVPMIHVNIYFILMFYIQFCTIFALENNLKTVSCELENSQNKQYKLLIHLTNKVMGEKIFNFVCMIQIFIIPMSDLDHTILIFNHFLFLIQVCFLSMRRQKLKYV
jgi:hypothetical protein